MIRTRLRHVTALAILLVGAPVGAYAADCECRHLEALQIELRNALRLQQAFNAAIPGLRTLSAPAAQARLQELAQSLGEGGFVRRPAGDRGPGA
ncbi:MAG TPA: hypothetical protein VJ890_11555, partial [Vineibacter sp.]|nr:hypothetical protein [Vineibacter sp.]